MGSLEARESLKAIAVGKQSSIYFLVAPHGGIRRPRSVVAPRLALSLRNAR